MRLPRIAGLCVGVMAAAALVSTMAGGDAAAALVVDPSKFPHGQTLTNGVLTVKVTNSSTSPVNCQLSVHPANSAADVKRVADLVNLNLAVGPTAVLATLRAQVRSTAIATPWSDHAIAGSRSASVSWNSERPETSYAIYQDCASTGGVLGLPIGFGAAQVYTVTGTGKSADVPVPGGNGSLGSLIPGL